MFIVYMPFGLLITCNILYSINDDVAFGNEMWQDESVILKSNQCLNHVTVKLDHQHIKFYCYC